MSPITHGVHRGRCQPVLLPFSMWEGLHQSVSLCLSSIDVYKILSTCAHVYIHAWVGASVYSYGTDQEVGFSERNVETAATLWNPLIQGGKVHMLVLGACLPLYLAPSNRRCGYTVRYITYPCNRFISYHVFLSSLYLSLFALLIGNTFAHICIST